VVVTDLIAVVVSEEYSEYPSEARLERLLRSWGTLPLKEEEKGVFSYCFLRELNPCFRRERAMS
jgi:hypothetical protein